MVPKLGDKEPGGLEIANSRIGRLSSKHDELAWVHNAVVISAANDLVVDGPIELKSWAIIGLGEINSLRILISERALRITQPGTLATRPIWGERLGR